MHTYFYGNTELRDLSKELTKTINTLKGTANQSQYFNTVNSIKRDCPIPYVDHLPNKKKKNTNPATANNTNSPQSSIDNQTDNLISIINNAQKCSMIKPKSVTQINESLKKLIELLNTYPEDPKENFDHLAKIKNQLRVLQGKQALTKINATNDTQDDKKTNKQKDKFLSFAVLPVHEMNEALLISGIILSAIVDYYKLFNPLILAACTLCTVALIASMDGFRAKDTFEKISVGFIFCAAAFYFDILTPFSASSCVLATTALLFVMGAESLQRTNKFEVQFFTEMQELELLFDANITAEKLTAAALQLLGATSDTIAIDSPTDISNADNSKITLSPKTKGLFG